MAYGHSKRIASRCVVRSYKYHRILSFWIRRYLFLPSSVFQTYFSAPSRQKVKLWTVWCVAVLGKISTAMWGHRLEILTTQWYMTDSPQPHFLSGWSTRACLKIISFLSICRKLTKIVLQSAHYIAFKHMLTRVLRAFLYHFSLDFVHFLIFRHTLGQSGSFCAIQCW